MSTEHTAPATEDGAVNEFGYKQELKRVLRLFAVFSVAFSIISITTGIFLNFGFGITHLGPASIWLWPIAAVGQTLVALIFAELATRIPLAGANYQWGARLVGPRYGYVVGSLGIMYSAVGMSGILLLGASPLLATVFGWNVGNPRLLLFIAIVLIVVAFGINLISIQLAARVNGVAVVTEIVGTIGLAAVIFVMWVVDGSPDGHGLGFLGDTETLPGQPLWYAVVLAALIGVYTLVGFEAAADMGEETINARRTVPRAIILSVVISSVLGMLTLIGFTIAIPDLAAVQASPVPLADITFYWLGDTLTKVLLLVVVFSMFALTVVAAAASARLIFAMARDNLLPGSTALRRVNPGTKTPVAALLASLVICVALMLYGYANGNAFGTLVGATALLPYLVYFLTVIAYGLRRRRMAALPDAFHLGRWAGPVFVAALVWLVAVLAALILPSEFRNATYVALGGLALAGFWYVVGLHKRLRDGTAGAMTLSAAGADRSRSSTR
ncbi:MAG: amino acid permease [Geodermatophilaceae bacterium]|nr:amino acid permease [Geodermatophilaceae bacterium]